MKNKLYVFFCITALCVLPLRAEDAPKPASVEQRLRETDISLALRQYERVQMDLFEARLKLDLLETDGELTETARKKQTELLSKKCDILRQRVDILREKVLDLAVETAIAKSK